MFERAPAPTRPDARRRSEPATAAPQAPEAANDPQLATPTPAPQAAAAAESTLPRYLRGGVAGAAAPVAAPPGKAGQPDPQAGQEGKPPAEKDDRAGAPGAKAGKEKQGDADAPEAEGEQEGTPQGRDKGPRKPGQRRAGKPGAAAGAAAGESRDRAGQGKAPAPAKPASAKPATGAGGAGGAAGAAAGGAMAAGGPAGGAAGGGGGGPAAAAAGAEAASEGAEAETESRLDDAEPETEAGDSGAAGGAAADAAPPAAAPADAGGGAAAGGAAAAESESAPAPSDAEGGEAGAEAAAPEVAEPAPAPPAAGAAGAAAADPEALAREQAVAEQRDAQADGERVAQRASESREEDQAEADADGGAAAGAEAADVQLAGPEREAALGSLGEELPAEGGAAGGGGGGGGGGGADAKADDTPPDVAGLPPEQGLAALADATPAQAEAGLGGVAAAAAAESAALTEEAQSALPEPTLGEAPGVKAAAPQGAPAAGSTPKESAAGLAPKAEPKPTPEPPKGNAADKVARPEIPKPAEGAEPSDAQKAQLASAISALPASDPGLNLRLGSAPQLALTGTADPAQVAAQKAQADQAVAQARVQEAAEVAKPLGEQDVRPTVGIAQIKARALKPAGGAAGGGGAAAGGGGAGGGAAGGDKARGILAEELKGPEVRAAMAAASAKAAAAKTEAQAKVAAGNAAAQAHVGELKAQAATDQDAARAKVRADAAAARSDYAAKQEAAVAKLDKTQQDTLAKTETQVADRKREGDEAAAAQIEEGDQQVADKQAEVESEVEGKKQEVQAASEEKGFFGRLADSVGAWFDRAKQWISEKVEAGKKWIKDTADRFKKYAAEKIDAARDAVTGLIKDAGAALIAASDVLLAEFPAARAAVRGTIEAGVEWGVNKTNQIAEGAKATVNKVVDTAAAVADAALDVGGKVVNAALDAAKATTVGALNAADKVAQALGVLKILIEDVASNPGGWISNLGASARDGVANHLAAAMKAAIKQWWEGKLESVLGVGPAIWETLKKGGLGLKEIGAMAWSAIKAAIPPALIQLVIEKLVAMIIPAAGAVMAIIEGLQAAWGSVSAILGAVGKAIAFLKAVKGGGAGPQFAALVAAAAIVVIDFVSNWLLARLGKAILKIGGKIKGIAQKLMKKISGAVKKAAAKRKAKGRAKAKAGKKKDKAARDRKAKQLREQRKARGKDKDPKKKDDPGKKAQDKEKAKADRLRRAVSAIRPKLDALLNKGVGRLRLGAMLKLWRVQHRLTSLRLEGESIVATVNPSEQLTRAQVLDMASRLEPIIERAEAAFMRALDAMGGSLPVQHGPRAIDQPASTGSVVNQLAAEKRAIERIPFGEQPLSWQQGKKFSDPVQTPGGEQVRITQQREGQDYMPPQELLVGHIFDNYKRLQGGVTGTGMSPRSLATLATESVRAPGMLPMAALAHKAAGVEFELRGAKVDDATDRALGRRVLREHNPMEPKGSGRAAAQDYWTKTGSQDEADTQTAEARNERRRRIWRVFSHIRRLVKQNKSLLGQEPALGEVAKSFEKWTQLNMPGAKPEPGQLQAAADRLEASIVTFMLTLK